MMAVYDDTAAIGKLYRRQDEIGTPWCVTVDVDSLEDGAVTVRDRDSMAQERVPVEGVTRLILDRLDARARRSSSIRQSRPGARAGSPDRRRPAGSGVPCSQPSIAAAARLPSPMARMTVAAPRTMSPPAKTPGHAGHARLVDHDVAPLVDLEVRARSRSAAGWCACRWPRRPCRTSITNSEPGDRYGPAPARTRPARPAHAHAAQAGDPAVLVAEHLDRRGEELELGRPPARRGGPPRRAPAARRARGGRRSSPRRRPAAARSGPSPWPRCRRRRPRPAGRAGPACPRRGC